MKLNDAIRIADELRDNAISEAQKLIWINELEMKIQSLILHTAPDDMIIYEQVDDTELLVPRPFDKVYYLWLAAMIDYGNAEYDKYQNDKAMADAAYSDYAKWFMRHFHDDCGNVMYIGGTTKYGLSAYQIACNHGFEGTEAEWILSLNGKDAYEVAVEKGYQGSEEEFYAQLGVLNGIEERVSADAAAAEAAADRTEAAASRVETAALHAPKVENGNWWVYDAARAAYMDTGVQAQGPAGEPGNGIRNMLWMKDATAYEDDRVVSRRYKLYITLDDGSTTEFTVEGGADGKPGLKGDGISDIYFSEETDDGYLYYARVGVAIYPIMIPRGPKGADGKETVLFVQDDEPTEAKVGDLWFDTDEEVDAPSGGASSWNDLTDKPFGEHRTALMTEETLAFVKKGDLYKTESSIADVLFSTKDETVAIIWDGVEYLCTVKPYPNDDSIIYVGNATIENYNPDEVADTGEPFFIRRYDSRGGGYSFPVYTLSTEATHTISVHKIEVAPLDEKFIPDTIQRTITGTPGDFVVIGEDGKATTGEPPAGGEEWRLIADIELTEEVNGVEITQDMDGNEIHLKKFYVLLTSLAPTANGFTSIKTVVNRTPGALMGGFERGYTISNNATNNSSTATRYFYCLAEFVRDVYCGCWHGVSTNLYNHSAEMQQMLRGYSKLCEDNDIFRILITPNDGGTIIGGVGSTVKIWGVDA